MRTISSLTYTNVALTVLILLLLALVVKPYLVTPAYAQNGFSTSLSDATPTEQRNEAQSRKAAALNTNAENAAAQREIADATRDVAAAIRESAKSQQAIAGALTKLGATK